MSSIPLAKSMDVSKMRFPVLLSEKIDGVPVRIDIVNKDGVPRVRTMSRQGKPMPSVHKTCVEFAKSLLHSALFTWKTLTFVGEIHTVPRTPFKDTCGKARRMKYDSTLHIGLFDVVVDSRSWEPFKSRVQTLQVLIPPTDRVYPVTQWTIKKQEDLDCTLQFIKTVYPNAEGFIARSWDHKFYPGNRDWGYQKLVDDPTADVRVVGMEVAIDKHGEPMDMVGAFYVEWKHKEIVKVGAGKLSHTDRRLVWRNGGVVGRIACIKYKRDPSYDKPRQPTFQHWRDDKSTPSFD